MKDNLNGIIKVEKNVPMPENLRGKNHKYPFAQMEVGDSFFVPYKDSGYTELSIMHNSVNSARRLYVSINKDKQFAVRKAEDKSGLRVWRIK